MNFVVKYIGYRYDKDYLFYPEIILPNIIFLFIKQDRKWKNGNIIKLEELELYNIGDLLINNLLDIS